MRRLLVLIASLAVIAGCATTANYERILNSWTGASADDLVRSWGPPTGTFRMANGNQLYVYDRRSSSTYTTPVYVTPGQTTGYWVGNTFYATTTPAQVTGGQTYNRNYACRTQFEIEPAGRIVHWRYQGNNCVALPPK